jgi:hypothetical protein
MQLIKEKAMDIQPMRAGSISRQDSIDPSSSWDLDKALEDPASIGQSLVRLNHGLGHGENDVGLVCVFCYGVDLSTRLLVGKEQAKSNSSSQKRLPVLPRDLDIRGPDTPNPTLEFPIPDQAPKDRPDDVLRLPVEKLEPLAGPPPLRVCQVPRKPIDYLVSERLANVVSS